VQTQEHDSDERAHFYQYHAANWLVEDPSGGGRILAFGNKLIAEIDELKSSSFEIVEPQHVRGRVLRIRTLYWQHTPALLRLQGASEQQLVGPAFLLVRTTPGPCWSPRPHSKNVVMAEIHQAHPSTNLTEVLGVLLQQMS